MDYLQITLIFLILLLSVFLFIAGIQVFFILKDLKKALDKFNRILQASEEIATDLEKPVAAAANVVTALESGVRVLKKRSVRHIKKSPTSSRRLFKKSH